MKTKKLTTTATQGLDVTTMKIAVQSGAEAYIDLCRQIKALEMQKQAYTAALIESMQSNGDDRIQLNTGDIVLAERTIWSYTAATEKAERELKRKKTWEQEEGKAKISGKTPYLVFKAK